MEPSLKQTLDEDAFSFPFNMLRCLGKWNYETKDAVKKNLFLLYRWLVGGFGGYMVVTAVIDLYLSRDDLKKVVFNVCTTILLGGVWMKNIHVMFNTDRLNRLRMNLLMDRMGQKENPEYLRIQQHFLDTLLFFRKVFYLAAYSLLPLWLVTSLATLVWGPRELPFAVWTPVDLNDNFEFFCGFMYHLVGSIYIVAEAIQADLAMFSLLLQIANQYRILAQNVREVEDTYMRGPLACERFVKDINKMLVNHRTKEKLKACVRKQLALKGYVKELEHVYSKALMIQLVFGFILCIGNGLELIVVSMSFSLKLSYQFGYLLMILVDIFMYCNLADILYDQGREVEWSLYDISWYEMDSEIRKYIILITTGAQKMQHLTAAKMFSLNLNTFLGVPLYA